MNCSSHSVKDYESTIRIDSESVPGVRFTIRKISFGRRLELSRRMRELAAKAEFHVAGQTLEDKVEAGILGAEIERVYLRWGLAEVEGLRIDGEMATPEILIESGPEELIREISALIRHECGLNEEERKN